MTKHVALYGSMLDGVDLVLPLVPAGAVLHHG